MIFNFFFLVLTIISFFGYSILIKKLIFKVQSDRLVINDYDLFFGFSLVFFLAFIFNIFLPLVYFTETFYIVGFILCFYFKNKINLDKKILGFFLILLTIVFITYNSPVMYDTKLYHIQILNWNSFYKLNFGLTNIEIRLGTNSFWQLILSIFNNPKYDLELIFLLNCIPISILINQFYFSDILKNRLSSIFLFACINFILLFSIIHPNSNGLILNSVRSPEVDTVAMFFFIFSVYFFLKYFEENNNTNYNYCYIFSTLGAVTKISHIGLMIFPIILLFYTRGRINRVFFSCCVIYFIWIIKSFIISGCWFFPIGITCYPYSEWSTSIKEINLYSDIVSSYPRAHTAERSFMDFDYTLHSYQWVIPWIKTYFLATGFFIIFTTVVIISSFVYFFSYSKKKIKFYRKNMFYFFLIFYSVNFFIWFNAPELRYGYGVFITFCCIFFSYSFKIIIEKYDLLKKFKILPLLLLLFLVFQNIKNLEFIYNIDQINFDNSNIVFFKKINGVDIYKSNAYHGFCNDFKDPCVVTQNDFQIKKNYGYNFFKSSSLLN